MRYGLLEIVPFGMTQLLMSYSCTATGRATASLHLQGHQDVYTNKWFFAGKPKEQYMHISVLVSL